MLLPLTLNEPFLGKVRVRFVGHEPDFLVEPKGGTLKESLESIYRFHFGNGRVGDFDLLGCRDGVLEVLPVGW
jgi:hypothetical protein